MKYLIDFIISTETELTGLKTIILILNCRNEYIIKRLINLITGRIKEKRQGMNRKYNYFPRIDLTSICKTLDMYSKLDLESHKIFKPIVT